MLKKVFKTFKKKTLVKLEDSHKYSMNITESLPSI